MSATHIVTDDGDPDPVGTTDTFEKDIAMGDVDRDGDVDLVIVRKVRFSSPGGKRNVLYLNDGGVMVDRNDLVPDFEDLTDDRDVILADVDGDQWLDLVTATTFSHQPRVYMNLGEDAGGNWLGYDWSPIENRIPPFSPAPKFCAVAAGDVDNDDDVDLFFVDYDNGLEDRLLINDGRGFFTDETDTRMDASMSFSAFGTDAQIVDMNGDGWADIVKLSTLSDNPNSIRILYNAGGVNGGDFTSGAGGFLDHVYTKSPYMMEVAHFNDDGRPDIYAVSDLQDDLLLNQGNDGQGHAVFLTQPVIDSPETAGFGGNTFSADLDQDGHRDMLVTDVDTDIPGCNRQTAMLRSDGNLPDVTLYDPLSGAQRPWLPNGTFDAAVFDADGDSWPDVWLGTCDGNRLFLGNNPTIFADGFESGDTTAWSGTQP